jgi:hypothetical protein
MSQARNQHELGDKLSLDLQWNTWRYIPLQKPKILKYFLSSSGPKKYLPCRITSAGDRLHQKNTRKLLRNMAAVLRGKPIFTGCNNRIDYIQSSPSVFHIQILKHYFIKRETNFVIIQAFLFFFLLSFSLDESTSNCNKFLGYC